MGIIKPNAKRAMISTLPNIMFIVDLKDPLSTVLQNHGTVMAHFCLPSNLAYPVSLVLRSQVKFGGPPLAPPVFSQTHIGNSNNMMVMMM